MDILNKEPMPFILRKRGKVYYADFTIKGKRFRPSLATDDKEIALIIAENLYKETLKKEYGIRGDITLNETLEKFINYSLKSKKSYKADISRAKNILEFFDGNIFIKDLKKSLLLDFIAFLKKEKGHSQKTVNNHMALLKAAINLVIADKEYSGGNPLKEIQIKKIKSKAVSFSDMEIQKILKYARDIQNNAQSKSQFYFYPFVYIALNSGLRAGEIFNLKWTDVRQHDIIIRDPKSQQEIERIPNLPWLWDFIQSLPKDSFWVMGTERKNPDTFRKIWMKMRALLNLNRKSTIHSLRHSFASYLSSQGVPLRVVQALLRHANITTTQIYLHTDFKEMREAMMKIRGAFE